MLNDKCRYVDISLSILVAFHCSYVIAILNVYTVVLLLHAMCVNMTQIATISGPFQTDSFN